MSELLTALVLHRPALDDAVVAGLSLGERWGRAFDRQGAPAEVLPEDALRARLRAAARPVFVADGAGAAEPTVLDALRQAAPPAADEAVLPAGGPATEGAPPVALLGPAAARALADAPDLADVGAAVTALAAAGGLRTRVVVLADPFWRRLTGRRDAGRATWALLKRARLRPGGLAARHVNRHVSVRISRLLVRLPLTPNHITTLTGLLGLVAAWLMLQPGYGFALAGAAVMQLSSIVDGCDGEVARLRFQSSEFGGWYDSVWDEIVNALFLFAVGWHLAGTPGWWAASPVWIGLGALAGGTSFLYALAHWHSKATRGVGLYWWFDQGKPKQQVQTEQTLMSYLKRLLWRDSFLLIYFLAAALHGLPVVLVISAGGAAATLGLLFTHVVVKRAPW